MKTTGLVIAAAVGASLVTGSLVWAVAADVEQEAASVSARPSVPTLSELMSDASLADVSGVMWANALTLRELPSDDALVRTHSLDVPEYAAQRLSTALLLHRDPQWYRESGSDAKERLADFENAIAAAEDRGVPLTKDEIRAFLRRIVEAG